MRCGIRQPTLVQVIGTIGSWVRGKMVGVYEDLVVNIFIGLGSTIFNFLLAWVCHISLKLGKCSLLKLFCSIIYYIGFLWFFMCWNCCVVIENIQVSRWKNSLNTWYYFFCFLNGWCSARNYAHTVKENLFNLASLCMLNLSSHFHSVLAVAEFFIML